MHIRETPDRSRQAFTSSTAEPNPRGRSIMLERKPVPTHGSIASTIMDQWRFPVFVVERDAGIRYGNAAAIAMLKEGYTFRQTHNTLAAVSPQDNARLKAAILHACSNGDRQTILIADFNRPKPQIVRVVPFHEDEPQQETCALISGQRCEPSDDVFAESLHQMFRLSAAETAIASALVCGSDVEQIAEMRKAKVATVRTQIAAMMLKAATRRKGDLVALFSRVSTIP